MELSTAICIPILVLAFFCEFLDSSLGMGYGTTLTPVLLMMGFSPIQIVPAVLISELFTGLFAAVLHHKQGNVDFRPRTLNPARIARELNREGVIEAFNHGVPRHLKVAMLLGVCSIMGTIAAVFVAVSIPRFYLKLYIGILVTAMGMLILVFLKKNFTFSWTRMAILGTIASFNKGMSGGGYGPVVTGGQVLSGLRSTNAVAITSLAEGVTCLVGVLTYLLVRKGDMDLGLVPWLAGGAMLSVPFSTVAVKRIDPRALKMTIGIFTIVLGGVTIAKLVF